MEYFATLITSALSAFVTTVALLLALWWLRWRWTAGKDDKRPQVRKSYFADHLEPSEIQIGLDSGRLFRGIVAVSKTGRDRAWIRRVSGMGEDLYLKGDQALNRALNGDEVVVDLETCSVVAIERRCNNAEVVGILRCALRPIGSDARNKGKGKGKHKNANADRVELQFLPNDPRVPILVLNISVVKRCNEAHAICESIVKSYDHSFERIPADRQAALLELITTFSESDDSSFHFDSSLSSYERKFVHTFAQRSGLETNSLGEGAERHIVVSKSDEYLKVESRRDVPINAKLFVATIDFEWQAHCRRPRASSLRCLGLCRYTDAHLRAILVEHAIDTCEPPEEVLGACDQVMTLVDKSKTSDETRRDLRSLAVFSIDPKGARDLDDALHAVPVGQDGVTEVGIHIADVSAFVAEGCVLDTFAKERGTTTYLPSSNYPMLPRKLADNACSLHGGQDRLAFSLLVHVSPDGRILDDPWFGRSIICSRGKLSYEEAREVLLQGSSPSAVDMCRHAEELVMKDDAAHVVQGLQILANVANALRVHSSKRGSSANIKPRFHLNVETGMVTLDEGEGGVKEHDTDSCDTCGLVEEYMLLANQLVATKLAKAIPSQVVLRAQAPPRADRVRAWAAQCARHAADVIEIDWKDLQPHQVSDALAALTKAANKLAESEPARAAGLRALAVQASRTMNSAQYISGLSPECAHWSLGMPHYTHFTSPIRRYADLLVHRQLAAVLSNEIAEDTDDRHEMIANVVVRTNKLAQRGKRAQQDANEMLLASWLEQQGPKQFNGVIVGMGKASATVLVSKLGLEVQCWYKDIAGCKRYEAVVDDGEGGHISEVNLFDDQQQDSEQRKCISTLRELDVCSVLVRGGLDRRVFIKATLRPYCSIGDSQEKSSSDLTIDDVPSPQDLARGTSDELNRTLTRMSTSGED